jgi:transcriptional regulator with XRE-family HTH domain
MAATSSPTVRRRQLAGELKRLRLAAKMTIEQVASTVDWSPGKLSRIENARNSINLRDTRILLKIYGVEGVEADALLEVARRARERGWWQQYGEAVPEWFQTYVGLEAEASSIARYQSDLIPGLLQTRDYATAVHSAAALNATAVDIERQVDVRMERQARLTDADAPELWVVLSEAVVRRLVGDREIMHDQLSQLIESMAIPSITLQVLPFSAGAHPAMDSAFSIVTFNPPTPGDVVYLEYPTGALYLEDPDDVSRYRLMFNHLRALAMSPEDTRRLLAGVIQDLG